MVKGVAVLAVIVIGGLVYFLPFIIGKTRGVAHVDSLFAVNLIFGWSVVGWIVAMTMAFRMVKPPLRPVVTGAQLLAPASGRMMRREPSRQR